MAAKWRKKARSVRNMRAKRDETSKVGERDEDESEHEHNECEVTRTRVEMRV